MLSTVASLKRKITVVQISVITVMNGLMEDAQDIATKNQYKKSEISDFLY